MSGTAAGGINAAKTNKEKHGLDFYKRIGSKGGLVKGLKKGFATMDPAKVSAAGAKGGTKSRRLSNSNSKRQRLIKLRATIRKARIRFEEQNDLLVK